MAALTLNNNQRFIMDSITYFFMRREHEVTPNNVSMYLEDTDISVLDQQQLYNYLYGVQENILYYANDNETRMRAKKLMEQFDSAIEQLEQKVKNPDDETETLDNENDHNLYNYTVSPIETDEYGVGLPIPILAQPVIAPEIVREWTPTPPRGGESNL